MRATDSEIVDLLAGQGYAVVPGFLADGDVAALAAEARQLRDGGTMRRAATGKGQEASVDDTRRSDFIHWLAPDHCSSLQLRYLNSLEQLRQAVNREIYLGLSDFEGHFALYPPGGFYRKHIDRFQNDNRRTLSVILYLNPAWEEADGGKLRLYLDETEQSAYIDIAPRGGTLVVFLSARFWHEVLPAVRERVSITGWFRTRGEALF